MALNSDKAKELVYMIRESFRIRENHDPVYVDIGDGFRRLSGNQHQVVFGRRGSGKSCLFVHFLRKSEGGPHEAVYVGVDSIKRLPFPDILSRILISIFDQLPGARRRWWSIWSKPSLLDQALTTEVERTQTKESKTKVGIKAKNAAGFQLGGELSESTDTKEQFRRAKLEHLERHLEDYKQALREALPDEVRTGVAWRVPVTGRSSP